MSQVIQRIRAFFQSESETIGISPKLLGPVVGGFIAYGLKQYLGIEPSDIADALDISTASVVVGETAIGSLIATYFLSPGKVVPKTDVAVDEPGSDEALTEEQLKQIEQDSPADDSDAAT